MFNSYKCTRCNYISYCNQSCQQEDWARCHKQDCKTLKRLHPMPYPYLVQLHYHIFQKQRRSPPCTQDNEDCFPTTIDQLESHHDKLSDTRRDEFETLLIVLKHIYNWAEDVLPEPSSLLKMFGATLCNGFSIMDDDLIGIADGIYLRASLLNHSCDPNCVVVFDGRKLQLRAIKDVIEGEECTISYVDVIEPAKERQAELEERYHFTCKCVKCIEEINSLGPDDDLDKELQRRLKKTWEQIEVVVESHNWTKVLQMCEPYLKPTDSSNSVPTNHRLLVRLRRGAIKAYVNTHAWEKAIEMGRLLIESLRYHYGPFSPILGTYLLGIGNALLELRRLQEAEKYLTEAKNVLEVTHGPKHALRLEVQELFALLEILKT